MTEEDAREWMMRRFDAAAVARVDQFVAMVIAENLVQNLVSPGSIAVMWARHVVDSAQLLTLVPDWTTWLDIGTGGGFPGMVVALLAPERSVTMVEPRRMRAGFLDRCVKELHLGNASVLTSKVETVQTSADVISARAVAPTDKLMRAAGHCATTDTIWLLPRGRSAMDTDGATMFHVEHSVTDPESAIIIAHGLPR